MPSLINDFSDWIKIHLIKNRDELNSSNKEEDNALVDENESKILKYLSRKFSSHPRQIVNKIQTSNNAFDPSIITSAVVIPTNNGPKNCIQVTLERPRLLNLI